jgi:hypothetical protein
MVNIDPPGIQDRTISFEFSRNYNFVYGDKEVKLIEIINRNAIPEPWSEGEKIPWNDPDFSQRMLLEHLSQEHEGASRRFETIDQHIT